MKNNSIWEIRLNRLLWLLPSLSKKMAEVLMNEETFSLERLEVLCFLFDGQLVVLEKRHCHPVILKELWGQKVDVLLKAMRAKVNDVDEIPFLPVIPKSALGILGLMGLVRCSEKIGECASYPEIMESRDLFIVPRKSYYIFGVNQSLSGEMVKEPAFKAAEMMDPVGLTDTESIALTVHSDILLKAFVLITGTKYFFPPFCYIIQLTENGTPILTGHFQDQHGLDEMVTPFQGNFIAPLCRSRGID